MKFCWGEAAELGPIDPQMQITVDQRSVIVPAGAAIRQFSLIHKDVGKTPSKMLVWMPIIRQYGPSFLQECKNAIDLSKELVARWLEEYMFKGQPDAKNRAETIATWLADHNNFKSHSRPVWKDQLLTVDPGIEVRNLSDVGEDFEKAIMDLYWAIDITFALTGAYKIIEHDANSALIRLVQQVVIPNNQVQTRPQRRNIPRAKSRRSRKKRR